VESDKPYVYSSVDAVAIADAATAARMYEMVELVRTEPMIAACVQRLVNNCMSHEIELNENESPLKPPLHALLADHYSQVLRQAIEVALLTGFVPFYVRRENGVPLPFIPELGTFVWSVETVGGGGHGVKRSRPEASRLVRYRVRMLVGNVKDNDILVIAWHTPILNPRGVLSSPLQYVFAQHDLLSAGMAIAMEKERWNTHKHLVVSEKLDLKDPTPSGMQLLDDMRRYSLTGQHNMMQGAMSHYYSRRDKTRLESVVDANHAWVHSEFTKDVSSAQALPHIMPPNSETSELTPLLSNDVLPLLRLQYHESVHVFFNGLNQPNAGAKYVGASGSEQASRAQHVTVLGMCKFLQRTAAVMYAEAFGVPVSAVSCKVMARSRLEITSVADIKVLVECGVMTDNDKSRLRRMYLGDEMDI
jgi:hypothetical protein